ncbi:MAG: hypothetical protein LBV17_03850 [Treponema sp.]|jgi:hypothetical protein|nr:hypothetical protein [Treponema sp.]
MKHHLEVTIPDYNSFYSLYADGKHAWKTYDRQKKHTLLYYAPGTVVFLYYTYVTYREACVIRNAQNGDAVTLPGLSKKVNLLFRVRTSRVDKLKRAAGWLNMHSAGAFTHDDGFYTRLVYILEQRGKINYPALAKLAENSSANNQINLF